MISNQEELRREKLCEFLVGKNYRQQTGQSWKCNFRDKWWVAGQWVMPTHTANCGCCMWAWTYFCSKIRGTISTPTPSISIVAKWIDEVIVQRKQQPQGWETPVVTAPSLILEADPRHSGRTGFLSKGNVRRLTTSWELYLHTAHARPPGPPLKKKKKKKPFSLLIWWEWTTKMLAEKYDLEIRFL